MSDCIFCKILHKEIPSSFVEETNTLIVIHDIAPKTPIHYLIISKKHIKDLNSLEKQDQALVGDMILMSQKLAKKYFNNGAFRLVINSGHAAGQRIFHLHMHVLAGKEMTD